MPNSGSFFLEPQKDLDLFLTSWRRIRREELREFLEELYLELELSWSFSLFAVELANLFYFHFFCCLLLRHAELIDFHTFSLTISKPPTTNKAELLESYLAIFEGLLFEGRSHIDSSPLKVIDFSNDYPPMLHSLD